MTLFGKRHSRLEDNDAHGIVWKSVGNAAARLALSLDRNWLVVHQQDNDTLWVVVDKDTPTWVEITAAGAAAVTSVFGRTGDVTAQTGDYSKANVGLGNVENLKVNLAGNADPGVGDDSGDGYAVGSLWINTTADTAWICLDATAGAAVWKDTTAAGGMGGGDVSFTGGTVTDNQIVRYDANGNQIQGGTNQPTVDDSGNITLPGTADLTVGGDLQVDGGLQFGGDVQIDGEFSAGSAAGPLQANATGAQVYGVLEVYQPGGAGAHVEIDNDSISGDGTHSITLWGGDAEAAAPGSTALLGAQTSLASEAGGDVLLFGGAALGSASKGGDVEIGGGVGTSTPGDIRIGYVSGSPSVNEILLAKGFSVLEGADHPVAPAAGKGQFWVKNETPSKPYFTDDAGNDFDLAATSGNPEGTDVLSSGPVTDGYVLTADGAGGAAWEVAPAGGSAVSVYDEGVQLTAGVTKFDFVGTGVSVTEPVANEVLVTIAGGAAPVASVFGRTGAVVAATSDYDAIQIDNTPAGNIAATNVQAAINELDTEKAATGHNHDSAYAAISHASSHQNNGADEISVTGLSGRLADAQPVTIQDSGTGQGDAYVLNFATNLTATVAAGVATINSIGGADATAIHTDGTAEIQALTEKASPVGADLIVIEDSAASYGKKKVQITNLPGGSGTDNAAIHDNVSAEISAITAKATPIGADLALIEDSAASNAKKSIQLSTLPVSTPVSTALAGKSDTGHNHDGAYSAIGHNHDSAYAPLAHVGAGGTAHANVIAAGAAGFMTGTDKTKLDGIEAAADVTDATNVTAAGALMDSEVTSLTGIKTLTVPDNTTISAFAATYLDETTAAATRTVLGAGDVTGPATHSDNTVPRWDGNDTKGLQASAVLVNDTNDMSGIVGLTITGHLSMSPGMTVDGVDVSAHAGSTANPHSTSLDNLVAGTYTQLKAAVPDALEILCTGAAGNGQLAGLTSGTPEVGVDLLMFEDVTDGSKKKAVWPSGVSETNNLESACANIAANEIPVGTAAGLATYTPVGTNTVVGRVAGNIVAAQLVNAQITDATIAVGKLASINATTIIGNNTGSPAVPIALTAVQVEDMLSHDGLVDYVAEKHRLIDISASTATPTTANRFHYETDANILSFDNGSSIVKISLPVDDSTLEATATNVRAKDGGITPAKLAAGGTTPDNTKFYRGDGTWQVGTGGGDVNGGSTSVDYEGVTYSATGGKNIGRSNLLFGRDSVGTGTRSLGGSNLGTMAGGTISGTGTISATTGGAVALGHAARTAGTCTLTAGNNGAVAFGSVSTLDGTGLIEASGAGTFATGYVLNITAGQTSSVRATGAGAVAHGYATSQGTILASQTGAIAAGHASANTITASAAGAIALGNSTSGGITASAANALQLGPGTNDKAVSVQVGASGTGIRLVGDGSTLTANGEIGTISGLAKIRSNGVNVAIAPVPKAWTIESPTSTENISGFYTTTALTISSCRAVQRGTTPSVTFSIVSGASRASVTTTHVSSEVTTSTTTGDAITVDTAAIPANVFVWLTTSAQSGTSTELNVTLMVYPT